MSASVNRQWLLARRPDGMVGPDDFERVEGAVPTPADGEALVEVCYLSFEPAMRTWMEDWITYTPPAVVGEPMKAPGVGRVVASNSESMSVGDLVTGMLGWQDYVCTSQAGVLPPGVPVETALGPLGGTGMTAYVGLVHIGRPEPGETVLVSGAAGATGSVAAQIARLLDCRTIGIAGGTEKCSWLLDEARLDAAIDYKAEDVGQRLAELCPDGVDVFFDNVGGTTLETALDHMALHGRVVACGMISGYNDPLRFPGPSNMFQVIEKRLRIEGFVLFDHMDRRTEATERLVEWVQAGELAYRTDVQEGFENIPRTFQRLFNGENKGKQLLKLRDI